MSLHRIVARLKETAKGTKLQVLYFEAKLVGDEIRFTFYTPDKTKIVPNSKDKDQNKFLSDINRKLDTGMDIEFPSKGDTKTGFNAYFDGEPGEFRRDDKLDYLDEFKNGLAKLGFKPI